MKIYNTTSRTIEDFVPLQADHVGIYACGPTVYNFAHIGNMRTYIFEDVLRRTFEKLGYSVKHVMNVTDVGHLQSDEDEGEDKISLAAEREKKTPWEIAAHYEEAFFQHSEQLGIKKPQIVCRATDHIPEMITMIETLVEKEFAYASNGNVYFDVSKFDDYAKFAKLELNSQQASDRVSEDKNKRNQTDFSLWFSNSKFPNQIMKWDSPWGVGFPGWHIECSAMASKYLGETFDIHCGGIDHIPVHHTNEIAQSDCCHGTKSVRYWMHGEFLTLNKEKMSKSQGGFITVDTLTDEGFNPLSYRYLVLTSHYRGVLSFSYEALQEAEKAFLRLLEKVQEWRIEVGDTKVSLSQESQEFLDSFLDCMSHDLRTPAALQIVWNVVRSQNLDAAQKLKLLEEFDCILGLGFASEQRGQLSEVEKDLFDRRKEAREQADWQQSDDLRDQLYDLGIVVKDDKTGSTWSRLKRS